MSDHLPAYAQYDLFFSPQRISALKGLRGKKWQSLVKKTATLPEIHPEALAFSLTMIDLCACETCDKDSYRAQLGCATCARRTLQSCKHSDEELLQRVDASRAEVAKQLAKTNVV